MVRAVVMRRGRLDIVFLIVEPTNRMTTPMEATWLRFCARYIWFEGWSGQADA